MYGSCLCFGCRRSCRICRSDGSSDKDNSTASLNAGVSLALNANEIDSIDVTAGVTDALLDTSNVGVTDMNVGRVAQALAEDGTEAAVADEEVLTDEKCIC